MEQRVHRRLQSRLHHHLRDPIRHGRYAQLPFPTVRLRYLHRPHRRRKVTARRHPIPDLVQVPFQVPFEIRNRLLVDPCRSLVRFHSLIRFPDLLLGNTERLCLTHRLLPLLVGSLNFGSITQPLRSIPFPGLPRYYGLFRPWAPLPYSRPRGSSTCGFSVRIGVPGSHVPLNRLWQAQATLMPDAAPSVNRLRRSSSRSNDSLRFRHRPYAFDTSSVVPLRSSSCQSPDLVLPRPFPSVLTTMAFDHSRRRWFGTCSCQPVPRGLPSSIKQLHTLGPPRPFALVAHNHPRIGFCARAALTAWSICREVSLSVPFRRDSSPIALTTSGCRAASRT